jgi:tripartite-type tricarboxylate transporter receptor subunit TctC
MGLIGPSKTSLRRQRLSRAPSRSGPQASALVSTWVWNCSPAPRVSRFCTFPFRGDSAAVTGLLGHSVDAIVAPGTVVLGNVQGGNFRALAITGSERWPLLKDVPTVAETVAPGFEMIAWIGVGTTHGVVKPIVDRLNLEFRRVIALPNVDEQLRGLGGFPKSSTPEEATNRVKFEIPLWKQLAQKAGIPKR